VTFVAASASRPTARWHRRVRVGLCGTSRRAGTEGRTSDMTMVADPVCGMRIDTDDAVASAEHGGQTYYFCSQACHDAFVADPASYTSADG
jgi:YHS domain-containing protein